MPWSGGGASSDRPPKEKTVGRELTRRAVEREGRSPPRFSRPYSARRDFGKISAFRGIGGDPDPAGRRSLTAAQAATGFTRNCVLCFTRKLVNFRQETWYEVAQSAFKAHCVRLHVFLDRFLPVPRVRYGKGYALFISTDANADAVVRKVIPSINYGLNLMNGQQWYTKRNKGHLQSHANA